VPGRTPGPAHVVRLTIEESREGRSQTCRWTRSDVASTSPISRPPRPPRIMVMGGCLLERMRPAEPGKEQKEQMRSLQALPEAPRKKAVKFPAAGFSCQAIFQKGSTVILACRTRPSSRKLQRPASPDSRLVPVVARSLAEPTVLKSSDFGKRRFAALAPRKSFTNTTPSAPSVLIQDRGGDQGDGDSLVVEELLRVAAARA